MSETVVISKLESERTKTPLNDNSCFITAESQNDPRFVKHHGLPPLDQAHYIPDDIMQALGELPPPKDNLGPTKVRGLNTTSGPPKRPAASIWSHKRREKFKHLTDTTTCKCGAGRDISFLYDVPLPKKTATHPDKHDKSNIRGDESKEAEPEKMQLPRTLVPEEYHLVKNKGVMGLEYYDDEYAMYVTDHEDHLTVFPSMKPSSRYEVIKLRQSMKQMLDKAGVNDVSTEVKGPTQMHNLLDLIKKEQNLYNVIFHEVIRQCSVECIERGQLLSDIRAKYNNLLAGVPIQIKGLHDEVLAQRALDRRLTEELLRFKSTISLLTQELAMVKAHDSKVTREAEQAQRELKNALQEAAKNASLLQEYHDLYELQRAWLEKSVDVLTEEREMWCAAAYSLAIKVTEESRLGSARKLHVVEKSWMKLANHFTILLSDQDTDIITQIQAFVDKFRNQIADFNLALLHREELMRGQVDLVIDGIRSWLADYKKTCMSREGQTIATPTIERQRNMLDEIHVWQETLQQLADKFVGDQTCTSEEELSNLRKLLDNWTDYALKLFNRHRKEDVTSNPYQENMIDINAEVIQLCTQYLVRLTGENGVAKGVILMMNMLETWETKLNLSVTANNPIPENHWGALQTMLEEWVIEMNEIRRNVGRGIKECESSKTSVVLDSHVIVKNVQKWATTSMTSIDSENAKLVEQVSSLHNEMVHWMIQMLLRLAPNLEGNSVEINQAALHASDSVLNLKTKAYKLFDRLNVFSKYVSLCCDGIVRENVQMRQDRQDESADLELKDLRRLRSECAQWIHTAKLLLCRLTGESEQEPMTSDEYTDTVTEEGAPTTHDAPLTDGGAPLTESAPPVKAEDSGGDEGTDPDVSLRQDSSNEPAATKEDHMEFIGIDQNTHKTTMGIDKPEKIDNVSATTIVAKARPVTPNTKKAFEALTAMTNLQDKLVEAEKRAFQAEERATIAEAEIVKQQEEIRAFKQQLEITDDEQEHEGVPSISKVKLVASNANMEVQPAESSSFITQQPTSPKSKRRPGSPTSISSTTPRPSSPKHVRPKSPKKSPKKKK